MNITKARQQAIDRRLRAVRVPLEPEDTLLDSSIIIEQLDGVNKVFDMRCGGTGYIFHLAIPSNALRQVSTLDFRCKLPWGEPSISWLEDPHDFEPKLEFYKLPNGEVYTRDECINHVILSPNPMRCCGFIKGLLLGYGTEPIPNQYQHGESVRADLDIFGHGRPAELELLINRNERRVYEHLCERMRRRVGPFARDPGSGRELPNTSVGEQPGTMQVPGVLPKARERI